MGVNCYDLLAVTGEACPSGDVLTVSGLRAKINAGVATGCRSMVIPSRNIVYDCHHKMSVVVDGEGAKNRQPIKMERRMKTALRILGVKYLFSGLALCVKWDGKATSNSSRGTWVMRVE